MIIIEWLTKKKFYIILKVDKNRWAFFYKMMPLVLIYIRLYLDKRQQEREIERGSYHYSFVSIFC